MSSSTNPIGVFNTSFLLSENTLKVLGWWIVKSVGVPWGTKVDRFQSYMIDLRKLQTQCQQSILECSWMRLKDEKDRLQKHLEDGGLTSVQVEYVKIGLSMARGRDPGLGTTAFLIKLCEVLDLELVGGLRDQLLSPSDTCELAVDKLIKHQQRTIAAGTRESETSTQNERASAVFEQAKVDYLDSCVAMEGASKDLVVCLIGLETLQKEVDQLVKARTIQNIKDKIRNHIEVTEKQAQTSAHIQADLEAELASAIL